MARKALIGSLSLPNASYCTARPLNVIDRSIYLLLISG